MLLRVRTTILKLGLIELTVLVSILIGVARVKGIRMEPVLERETQQLETTQR